MIFPANSTLLGFYPGYVVWYHFIDCCWNSGSEWHTQLHLLPWLWQETLRDRQC